jgi:hypothetical protein
MSIRLTWTNRVLADELRVYRDTVTMDPESLPSPLATLPGSATEYLDETVVVGAAYFYRVAAVKLGESPDLVAVSQEISLSGSGDPSPSGSSGSSSSPSSPSPPSSSRLLIGSQDELDDPSFVLIGDTGSILI